MDYVDDASDYRILSKTLIIAVFLLFIGLVWVADVDASKCLTGQQYLSCAEQIEILEAVGNLQDEPCLIESDYLACKHKAHVDARFIQDYAPIMPYADCSMLNMRHAHNVTDEWVTYKYGTRDQYQELAHWFDIKDFTLSPVYFVNGVAMKEAQPKYETGYKIIYAGWYWDLANSINGVIVGHPSCGVHIQSLI
jgi:hypothetical protein